MSAQDYSTSPPHPAPGRREVSNLALWFGLLGAPCAWAVNELLLYFIASHLCEMKTYDITESLVRGTSPWFIAISIASLIIALAGVWVSFISWKQSKQEKKGSGHHLIDVGEGRTRFLAMSGLISSVGFSIGFLFIFTQLFAPALC